jgi:Holliday junction resolvase RusA-like endonuclease
VAIADVQLQVTCDEVLTYILGDPEFSCVVKGVPVPTRLILGSRLMRLSPKVQAWRMIVWSELRDAIPIERCTRFPLLGPVVVSMIFRLPRPQRLRRVWPAVVPDIKNLMAPVEDALAGRVGKTKRSPGLIVQDDSQIVGYWMLFKRYATESESPGVEIKVWTLKSRSRDESKAEKR